LVKVIKPIVDVIRNIEVHDTRLTDCILELIWYAQAMNHIPADPEDDIRFTMHAQAVFN
jgi:hypothetical protein